MQRDRVGAGSIYAMSSIQSVPAGSRERWRTLRANAQLYTLRVYDCRMAEQPRDEGRRQHAPADVAPELFDVEGDA